MPQITLQDSTFERLQHHAKPLVDTVDTIINRALDAYEQVEQHAVAVSRTRTDAEHRIDPLNLPNLTHTKVLDASIAGEHFAKANWNLLLVEMLHRAMASVGTFEKLRQLCPINMMKGKKEDEGFSYLSDINISFQGQDSNGAGRAIVNAAIRLGIEIDIAFLWRTKEGAAHPGETARLLVAS